MAEMLSKNDDDLLNDFGVLPDPVPGEIVAYVDGEPIYAEADPGEVEAPEELPEELDLPGEDEAFPSELTEEEKAEIQSLFDELENCQI